MNKPINIILGVLTIVISSVPVSAVNSPPGNLISVRLDDRGVKVWNSVSDNTKKSIYKYLVMQGGLSSTGRIELVRCFRKIEHDGFSKHGDTVFQFDQLDLSGERLFWSYLVNVTNGKYLKLYPQSKDSSIGNWKKSDLGGN